MTFFNKNIKGDPNEHYRRIQLRVLYSFCMIIIIVSMFLTSIILEQSSKTMQKKVASLVAANSRQLQLNINSYLREVESTASLLFADESYYAYDATDETLDEYDKVVTEEKIVDRIVDIGLMENFSDFSIVYANDHTVGWLSKTTAGVFPDGGIYDTFEHYITNDKTESGWAFGVGGNTDRLYYVKRLNPDAILVASFYSKELNSVFEYPEELKGMTIRLINDEESILYSSEKTEIGQVLPKEIAAMMTDESNFTSINESYLLTSNQCTNGWRVVCTVSMDTIMEEYIQLKHSVYLTTAICVLIFIIAGMLILHKVTKPVDGLVSNLENKATVDELSGVYNKRAFEEQVNKFLAQAKSSDIKLFIMFDVDNFKQVNDRLGHAKGDFAIARMGHLLNRKLDSEGIIGRLGGDEFAYYKTFEQENPETIRNDVIFMMDDLLTAFAQEFMREHELCDVSLSAGVWLTDGSILFDDLYKKADSALYISKRNGKHQYTIYEEGMEDHAYENEK